MPVRWLDARATTNAFTQPGVFVSHVTVCKLRDERTIDAVYAHFDVPESS